MIAAVAETTGRPPLELEPLAHAIDPDALNALVGTGGEKTSPVTVTFEYCEELVTVTSGEVRVYPRT